MSDETSRVVEFPDSTARTSKTDFSNIEFLETSLADPLNVLRIKLRDLSEMPDHVHIRRVIVITETITDDGRGLDVVFNEHDEEPTYVIQDSLVSILERVRLVLMGVGD